METTALEMTSGMLIKMGDAKKLSMVSGYIKKILKDASDMSFEDIIKAMSLDNGESPIVDITFGESEKEGNKNLSEPSDGESRQAEPLKKIRNPYECNCKQVFKDEVISLNLSEDTIETWVKDHDKLMVAAEDKLEDYLKNNMLLNTKREKKLKDLLVQRMIEIGKGKSWDKGTTCYPPHCLKLLVAELLVKKYPITKIVPKKLSRRRASNNADNSQSSEDGEVVNDNSAINTPFYGFEYWYDGEEGVLETRLKYLRPKVVRQEVKKYKPRQRKADLFNLTGDMDAFEEYKQKILTVRNMRPTEKDKNFIFAIMQETREFRRTKFLNDLQSWQLSAVLKEYPHFISFKAEMLHEEFQYIFPEAGDILAKLAEFLPNVRKYLADGKHTNQDLANALTYIESLPAEGDIDTDSVVDIPINKLQSDLLNIKDDENMLLITLLATITSPQWKTEKKVEAMEAREEVENDGQPPSKKTKIKAAPKKRQKQVKTRVVPNSKLLKIIPKGEDLLESSSKEAMKHNPIIILESSSETEKKYFLRVCGTLTDFGNDFLGAFLSYLFLYTIFDLTIPDCVKNFITFIQSVIMNVKKESKADVEMKKQLLCSENNANETSSIE